MFEGGIHSSNPFVGNLSAKLVNGASTVQPSNRGMMSGQGIVRRSSVAAIHPVHLTNGLAIPRSCDMLMGGVSFMGLACFLTTLYNE